MSEETLISVVVNGREQRVPLGVTVLQACEMAGVEIPRFCYHERLEIAGNCRMCLVEVEKAPKPVASCAMPAADKMVIRTDSALVQKAREGVMEFLLINHPLDCPICDQGGECDLQDQAMAYGRGVSRYREVKRAVEDKPMGPLIKTHMTRCIHCTRCVRFITELAGVPELGAFGRGEHMEVGTYVERALSSELSGNIIDLCPVGALTSKPYAYQARSWELRSTESVDVVDAVGSNIRIDARGGRVMRILPRLHDEVNEEWLSDKARFACDALGLQRLDRPMVRRGGQLVACDWDEAYGLVADAYLRARPEARHAWIGPMVEAESMVTLSRWWGERSGGSVDARPSGIVHIPSDLSESLCHTTLKGLERADAILLVGVNPRQEAPLFNLRLRKAYVAGDRLSRDRMVGVIGQIPDQTYPTVLLGDSWDDLDMLLSGDHPWFSVWKSAKRPVVVVGSAVWRRSDAAVVLSQLYEFVKRSGGLREDWCGLNFLAPTASWVGAHCLGLLPYGQGNADAMAAPELSDFAYFLGYDESWMEGWSLPGAVRPGFVVYQGHHGDVGASVADVVLPGAAYTEKNGTYVNMEGRTQRGYAAVTPPGDALEDWRILSELWCRTGGDGFGSLASVREALVETHPVFGVLDRPLRIPAVWKTVKGLRRKDAFRVSGGSYYQSDAMTRHSPTMARCVQAFETGGLQS
jgi:NADH-quinone oxidoreductase subunit G